MCERPAVTSVLGPLFDKRMHGGHQPRLTLIAVRKLISQKASWVFLICLPASLILDYTLICANIKILRQVPSI